MRLLKSDLEFGMHMTYGDGEAILDSVRPL